MVKEKGGFPSNVLNDNVLVMSDDWKKFVGTCYYPAWTNNVLVYPAKNGRFKREDVIDAVKDQKGRAWVFPKSQIPEIAIGREKVGLFVYPQYVEVNCKSVVILADPKSVFVLTPFIQNNGQEGKVDEATRVPLYVEENQRKLIEDSEKRWLWRIDGTGVRPMTRGCMDYYRYNKNVGAYNMVEGRLGVANVFLRRGYGESRQYNDTKTGKNL